MAAIREPRKFAETPDDNLHPAPLLIGLMGPPGGGKTKSALRLADGMRKVRGDTEAGRALKYKLGPRNPHGHDFTHLDFKAPFEPEMFLDAIKQAVALKPSCIIVDSMSDEHEGDGGVLDWHDRMVPTMGGNEWAAWSKPKASRRKLIAGIQQINACPVIFCFRAREKTVTQKVEKNGRTRDEPVNIGFQPIAPPEIVHVLDLTCLLPPRANGVAMWSSPKGAEDFVIKLPEFLQPYIRTGHALDEAMGEGLGRWASGDLGGGRQTAPSEPDFDLAAFVAEVEAKCAAATSADDLKAWANSEVVTAKRSRATKTDPERAAFIRTTIADRIGMLTAGDQV
jgi:hypothetical protein